MGTVGPYTKILYRRDRRPPPSPTMLWAWELDKIFLQTPPHFHFPDNSLQTPPPVLGAMEACSVLQAVARAGRATSSVAAPRPSPRSGTVLRTDLRLRPSRRTVVVAQAADGEAPAEAAPAPAAPRAKPAPKGASAFSPAELEASLTRLQSNKLDLGKLKSGLGSRASPELTKMLASFDEYQSQVAGVLDAIHGKAEKLQEQEVRKEGRKEKGLDDQGWPVGRAGGPHPGRHAVGQRTLNASLPDPGWRSPVSRHAGAGGSGRGSPFLL